MHAVWWAPCAPFLVLVLVRLTGLDRSQGRLFQASTFFYESMAPIPFVVLVVLARRRTRRITFIAPTLAVTLLALAFLWPVRPWSARAVQSTGPALRVVTTNSYLLNDDLDDYVAEIATLDADVIAVHEISEAHDDALRALADHGYRYRWASIRGFNARAHRVYSRHPIVAVRSQLVGLRVYPTVTIDVDGTRVDVISVHASAVLGNDQTDRMRGELEAIDALARDAIESGHPVVVAGDFNASHEHAVFRDLLDGPLVDAHLARGQGLQATWPARSRIPPFALIDRVLVSEDVGVAAVANRAVPGTDHQAVIADLVLPGPGD